MSILQKLHDELTALENRFHALVEPEKLIADKVREIVGELVAEVQALKEKVEAAESKLSTVVFEGKATATAVPPQPAPALAPAAAAQPTKPEQSPAAGQTSETAPGDAPAASVTDKPAADAQQ